MRERERDGSSKLKRRAVVMCQTLSFRVDCSETSFTRTTNKELFIGGFLYHVNLINDYGLIMLVKPMRKQGAVAFEQWEQAQDTVQSCVHFCVQRSNASRFSPFSHYFVFVVASFARTLVLLLFTKVVF